MLHVPVLSCQIRSKPKDVRTMIVVESEVSYEEGDCIMSPDFSDTLAHWGSFSHNMFVGIRRTFSPNKETIFMRVASLFFASFAAIIFSAIHIMAWNFFFPSKAEKILWRCSTVIATVSMLGFTMTMSLLLFPWRPQMWRRTATFRFNACLSLYIISRVVLLAQTFICLRLMPASAYQTVGWVQALPHI